MNLKTPLLSLTLATGISALLYAQQTEHVDLNAIHKIKVAELSTAGGRGGPPQPPGAGSQVMDTMWFLTDRYGPRLANSPQFRAAGEWAVTRLKEWGLNNVHLEKWATKDVPSGPIPGWQIT